LEIGPLSKSRPDEEVLAGLKNRSIPDESSSFQLLLEEYLQS
jgi:hypothetical protein